MAHYLTWKVAERFARKACPTGKVCHFSEEKAWETAAEVIEHSKHQDLQVYQCRVCFHYHLTTASVQLHNFWWKPERTWPRNVESWLMKQLWESQYLGEME